MDVWNTIISENVGDVPHTIHSFVHYLNGRANELQPTFFDNSFSSFSVTVSQVEVLTSGMCYDCVP